MLLFKNKTIYSIVYGLPVLYFLIIFAVVTSKLYSTGYINHVLRFSGIVGWYTDIFSHGFVILGIGMILSLIPSTIMIILMRKQERSLSEKALYFVLLQIPVASLFLLALVSSLFSYVLVD